MKVAALALLALFSFSILASIPNAWALSPITFATAANVGSSSQQFRHVYENGTNSVIFLDSSPGLYFESEFEIATNAVSSSTFSVTSGGDTTDSDSAPSPIDLSRYSLSGQGSNDYVDISGANFNFQDEITVVARIYPTTLGVGSTTYGIVTKAADDLVFLSIRDNKLAVFLNGLAAPGYHLSTASLTANTWQCVGTTYNSATGNIRFYIGGSLDRTQTTSGSLTSSTANIQIGNWVGSSGGINGQVDDVAIYHDEKDGTFMSNYCNGNFSYADAEGFYDFNEGIESSATDLTGNGNDGTLTNDVSWSGNVQAASLSRPTTYTVGRDSGTGNLVYGKINIFDLGTVDSVSQASTYHPRDIVQTTDTLYSPLYNLTTGGNGQINLGSITRNLASYSEAVTLHAGNSTVPAHATMATQNTGTTEERLRSGTATVAAEKFTGTAAMNGKAIDGLSLSLGKGGSPTGTATIGTFDSSGNVVTTFASLDVATLTTSQTTYYFPVSPTYEIQTNDYVGIKFAGGDASNYVQVFRASTDVYDGTNAIYAEYQAGWSDQDTNDLRFSMVYAHIQSVVYDSGTDSIYTFFESGTNTIRAVKRTGSTTLLGTSMSHTTGEPFSVVQLANSILIQTATDTYTLNTSTDAITETFDHSFNTRYPQTISVAPVSFSFNTVDVYLADSTEAYLYDPATDSQTQTGVLIDTVNTGQSGTIAVYDPTRYYYLQQNDITAEASGTSTTWTIKHVGSKEDIQITADTEAVGITLIENTTAILGLDVVHQICDNGDYLIELEYYAVGSDADCTYWWTYDTSAGTAPRVNPYVQGPQLVHANEYSLYTFTLSAADPSLYSLETIYDNKVVDTGNFDSGGQLQQRLLYQQCYIISIEETNTGNTVQTGTVCAGDDTIKPISLTGIIIPSDWLGTTWSHTITRYFNGSEITPPNPLINSTNNSVLFTFQKNVSPYNATVNVVDNIFDTPTINANFTFTAVSGVSVVNMTSYGINSNQTLYFTVYENGVIVIEDISTPQSFMFGDTFDPSYWGLLFGVPAAFIFPFLIAVMFPKSLAYFGAIVTVAIIGIMQVFGFIELPIWYWGIIMPVVALAVIVGYKR